MFNLLEGNKCQTIQSDGYYGGAGFMTLFRNACSGNYPTQTFARCIDITHYSYWFNVVANVLGTDGISYEYMPYTDYWTETPLIYRLGYPGMGNMNFSGFNPPSTEGTEIDFNVMSNVLLVANFDYVNNAIINPTNGLPVSLYRDSAPPWFGSCRWPAIDPTATPMLTPIPAELRYYGTPNPPPATGIGIVVNTLTVLQALTQ
jgi:hypothetical protein